MTDRNELVRDLLPSPTAEAPRPSPPPPPPSALSRRRRPITTDDLQHRSCWICADSEDDDDDSNNAGNESERARNGGGGAQSANNNSNNSSGSGRRKSSRKFVHPCKCTLVAHQSCLLSWIAQSRQNRPGEPVKCPQCQAVYIILENRPWLLNMLDWADRQVSQAVKVNVWVLLTTTTLFGAAAYGCLALRLALGKEAASRTLRSPWPLRYYIQVPLIPFALIASKLHFLRLFDPLTPWLIAFLPSFAHLRIPFFHMHGMAGHRRLTGRRTFPTSALQRPARVWPPNPGPTAMMIPFVRFAYLFLRLKLSKHVLRPWLDPRRANRDRRRDERAQAQGGQQGAAQRRQGPTRTQRVVVLGAEGVEARLLDADPPPGTAAVVEEERQATAEDAHLFNSGNDSDDDDDHSREDDELTGNGDLDAFMSNGSRDGATVRQQTVYITRQSVGRLVLSALTLPIVASGMGSLLASVTRLTSKGSWARRFLGLDFDEIDSGRNWWRSPLGAMQDFFSSSSSSTSSDGGSPLSHIFYPSSGSGNAGGSNNGNSSLMSTHPSTTYSRAVEGPSHSGMSYESSAPAWLTNIAFGNGAPTIYDDLVDAPWFRNAIGGLLFIALQDAVRITHRYMKLRQRGRVSVRDLPFEEHLAGNLDLRPGR
ncbi:unnamed protein product [Tilletia controversa]|uniref:RING-CH-type domain-containing protein n=3 Tax=Tilletia TaxID=13289 RepID=A0A8X7MZS7_9BASI|nr:hypothetical protein CF336_g1061 [Tilletia laevis]KAE8204648.1 hypothetical protein CF328_g964 [Tilletia controversa]KAE8264849.1 hypothetical protein A4X03_0g660 [Tilletia caries]KAE8208224.1 hypothetical protein CF335_g571 [Tilletia laevis]KAE8253601.1 hypothetical protein A4X06_0g1333 [Tilletia controversa]